MAQHSLLYRVPVINSLDDLSLFDIKEKLVSALAKIDALTKTALLDDFSTLSQNTLHYYFCTLHDLIDVANKAGNELSLKLDSTYRYDISSPHPEQSIFLFHLFTQPASRNTQQKYIAAAAYEQ